MRNPVVLSRRRFTLSALSLAATGLSGCAGNGGGSLSEAPPPAPAGPQQPGSEIGSGHYKVALILPLSSGGNAGMAAQSMKNAAEMALAEFSNPDIQFLIKDDAGNPQLARMVAGQAMDEGAQIILGPLFAQSVQAVGSAARPRNIPVIGFSTDASVAARGVYLLSFLPETDVVRVLGYAFAQGKRSFAAIVPENAYGSVVEAAFREEIARRGGRVVALERYDAARLQASIGVIAQAARGADAVFIPDGGDVAPTIAQGLVSAGVNTRQVQLLGTGLWDDPRIFNDASMLGGLYAAPDPSGFANFAQRYQTRYGSEPVRTATLAYDSTALVAALVRSQGAQRITDQMLTNPSGFSGIDGVFRFKADGTNERGLAVMRVAAGGGQIVSPAPKTFGGSGT
ncbi:penicillin-binding protein activator [Pseudorhodoplanes sp.]|uniref:penicillin-binding protein activator n=1 Tax=Pseudorhodoplanes sp. TaxID=1934341 RepID=UPI002BCDF208|nr:penicillin-binding protein activator [Pseudorhodoplanes sp.]HWV51369.1 penicillin-binding protein activator [Pseudorhodoplanes sp.]